MRKYHSPVLRVKLTYVWERIRKETLKEAKGKSCFVTNIRDGSSPRQRKVKLECFAEYKLKIRIITFIVFD